MVLLVHFKNSVKARVTALLNDAFVKTEKTINQCFRPCFSVLGLLRLSERSLVDTFGTSTGRGVQHVARTAAVLSMVGVPGVMVVGW